MRSAVGPSSGSAFFFSSFLSPRQLKTSGRAATRAPRATASSTAFSACSRFASLSSEASICIAAAVNFISLSIQEYRARALAQDVLGRAPDHELDDAPVAVGADEDEIVAEIDEIVDDLLLGVAARQLVFDVDAVRAQIRARGLEHFLAAVVPARDVEDGERELEPGAELRGGVHRRAGALTAVKGEQRPLDRLERLGRDEDRPRRFPSHGFRHAAQEAGGEFLVDAALADHNQINRLGALADLVRDN